MFCSHLAACGCVLAPASDRGPSGSPGRGELLRLSRLGELLLVETSLLLQLLVAEEEEALDTMNPGECQPYTTDRGGHRSVGTTEALFRLHVENSPDPHSRL